MLLLLDSDIMTYKGDTMDVERSPRERLGKRSSGAFNFDHVF